MEAAGDKMRASTRIGLRLLIAAIVAIIYGGSSCAGCKVYFPMSLITLKLPINEKSQSIFSKIPIGRFQVLYANNNSLATDYIYSLEDNNLLRIDAATGEVFIKDDYESPSTIKKFIVAAIAKNLDACSKITHMSLELEPITESIFCKNLENVCFWSDVHYTLMEDFVEEEKSFKPLQVGSLAPRAAKYLCPVTDVKYMIEKVGNKPDYFAIKNNILYTNAPIDYESLNVTQAKNLTAAVVCNVRINENSFEAFRRTLNILLVDRNDNGPELQRNKMYSFNLEDPHFKANDNVGDKIIFIDKDSVQANAHLTYTIYNDTNDIVRPVCNVFEADHTGKRNSVISCQLTFSRNGLLSDALYCFILEAGDRTIDVDVNSTAKANICLHTDVSKIHEADRPRALALRSRQHRKSSTNIVNSAESMLNEDGTYGRLAQNVLSTYPKDVYVYRTATAYSRVAQPEDFVDLMSHPNLHFEIVEDRSGAFAVTPLAGIIYVKDSLALQSALETIYFLNITWQDTHPRSFVINVHLTDGRPENASCEHKTKSRSQTCAQIKYQKQCIKFCGLATNGGGCAWRGSNSASFSRNYASCVPEAKFCPDNICDPLEDLNNLACPQDCALGAKIVGPHSVNDNKRGILSASGTCICEDNGKCSCAPLDDDEPKPKRKRKNDQRPESGAKLPPNMPIPFANVSAVQQERELQVAGFVCGKSCLIIAVTCPLVFAVLLLSLVVSRRNLKRRTQGKESASVQKSVGFQHENGDCDVRNGDLPLLQLENGFKFDGSESKWEFERELLVLDAVLGEGEFGKVVKGYATDIAGIKGVTTVAVKMLKKGANSVEYMALLSEFQLLQEVAHPNVIKLLGACTKGDCPMIIIEYARYGSLRSYLRLSRKIECSGVDFTDGVEPVTVKNILSFAWQICKGMTYLTEIKLVHRDLAARNVLLADGKICKVSDFGLTRDVYEDDAYLKRSRDRVPVKWMAPESLADHVYTTKSDVWAFGVLCWELITLGASPYPGIPPQNLYHLLKSGYRMERPENCSEDVYTVIRACWVDDPNGRPSFKYLASQFEKLLGNNAKYIELETNAVSNPIYCSDEAKFSEESKIDLSQQSNDLGDPECLDHLWHPPKMCYELHDGMNSREFSSNFSAEFQAPPGYDLPRALIETSTTEQALRYENDLRFPLNIRKSVGTCSIASSSQNGSKYDMPLYSVPVKRGRSYVDMTNKTMIPDNLDNKDFEKHVSKTISFRFSSLLNLKEQEQDDEAV